jgi:hypothetical protein
MSETEREGMITLPEGLLGGAAAASPRGLDDESAEETILVDRGVDESVEETILVDRGVDESVEETILVDRGDEFDEVEATIVVGRDDGLDADTEVEATVVVERTGERSAAHPVDEATVVVERTGEGGAPHPLDEATVVVERTGEPGPSAAADPADEATAVRQSSSRPPKTHPAASVMHAPTRRSRRAPKPAPVSEDVLSTAEHGPGAGVLDAYPSRPAEPPRIPIPDLGEGPAPTRDPAHVLPSVAKRSRRTAMIGLGAVAVAAVLGLVGFVSVCATVIASLLG